MIRYHPSVTLSSITPVYDFTFAPIWNHSTRTELPDCERLYVASGSHPQSRLSVITSQPFLHTLQSSPHGDILTGIWTVCIQGMVLVVLGYPSCTKLLYVKDHGIQGIEFEDISELSWINSNCETRSIGTVSNSLIQIQKSELQLSIPKYKSTTVKAKRWIPTVPINIIDGIFNDEYVIMYTSNPSTLIVLKVLADVQSDSLFVDQISSIALDFQVSCIYHPSSALHFRVVPEPIIILGTFQPSLKIITLNSLLTSMLCLHTIDLSLFADMYLNIPHSIILFTKWKCGIFPLENRRRFVLDMGNPI
ncbi:hypothetical protein BC833DRAFT_154791 [Globomyces pollinis-pini]|nr:hypothetical protein BC833DRAFT_154791 [Globomyces pollinis-pini]